MATKSVMTVNDSSIATLVSKLTEGWAPGRSGSAMRFLQAWKDRLATTADVKEFGNNWLYFVTELPGVHLLGTDDVHALLFVRNDDGVGDAALRAWKRQANAPRRLLLVFALTQAACDVAHEVFGQERSLVVSPEEIVQVLGSDQPSGALAGLLRRRIPIRSLIPYNYLRPALGNLFFGRRSELARLLEEEEVSFAIAGPGMIGKTSMLQQYQRLLQKRRDPRALRMFDINFYPCSDTTSQVVARFFAMRIDGSNRSHRMTAEGLV